jgi:hypothetical protein
MCRAFRRAVDASGTGNSAFETALDGSQFLDKQIDGTTGAHADNAVFRHEFQRFSGNGQLELVLGQHSICSIR